MGGRIPTITTLFRRRLVTAGVLVVVLAAVAQFLYAASLRRETVRQRLEVSAKLGAAQIAEFIEHHRAAVGLYAARRHSERDWPRGLGAVREHFPGFITLLVTDRRGRVLHAVPEGGLDRPERWRGLDAGDREYFRVPKATGRPHVSDVFLGRAFGQDPLVAVSAPVFDARRRFEGVVEGSIHSDAFAAVRTRALSQQRMALLVLDRDSRVVHASPGLAFAALQTVRLPPPSPDVFSALHLRELDGVFADGGGAHVAQARTPFGWTVVVLEPVELLHGELRGDALNLLVPALLALAAMTWAASALARQLAEPIDALARRMREYAFDRDGRDALPLPAAPAEIRDLTDAFNHMGERLRESYDTTHSALTETRRLGEELSRTLQEREAVIAERTEALRRANRELHALSATDALTGCSNYRGFAQAIDAMWEQARDSYQTLTAYMCDIDHFKRYNDALGHPAGDACLRRVAAALRGVMHDSADVVARVGGEEFAVLVLGLDAAHAHAVGERLHAAVHALEMPHPDGGEVSVSVGWAQAQPALGGAPQELVAAADAALYRAKAAGRDRVAG